MDLNEVDRFDQSPLEGMVFSKTGHFVESSKYDQALSLIRAQQELLKAYRELHLTGVEDWCPKPGEADARCPTCKAADALLPPIASEQPK